MKKLKLSLYVIMPIVFCFIIHLIFYYGNALKPLSEWSDVCRIFAGIFMVLAFIVGVFTAKDINE